MNNIRKLKKKKISNILNPEQLAQQKLFQISRFQDQQPKEDEADLFLDTKFTGRGMSPVNKIEKGQRSSCQLHQQNRKPRVPSILSLNNFKRKSGEIKNKQQLPLTHYLVIDERDKSSSKNKHKSARYDVPNLLKQKLSTRKIKVRSVPIASHSYQLHRQIGSDNFKSLKGNAVYAIQVKNITLLNKYPFFMDH